VSKLYSHINRNNIILYSFSFFIPFKPNGHTNYKYNKLRKITAQRTCSERGGNNLSDFNNRLLVFIDDPSDDYFFTPPWNNWNSVGSLRERNFTSYNVGLILQTNHSQTFDGMSTFASIVII